MLGTVRRRWRRGGRTDGRDGRHPKARRAPGVALDDILDCGTQGRREDRSRDVFRDFGHDRFEIRAAAGGEDLLDPRHRHSVHLVELERGRPHEGHNLGRCSDHNWRRPRPQEPGGACRPRGGDHARRHPAARGDERLHHADRRFGVGDEHDRLHGIRGSGCAVDQACQCGGRGGPVPWDDMHGVLAARDGGRFRRLLFHLSPVM
jgi:hypothetical protein